MSSEKEGREIWGASKNWRIVRLSGILRDPAPIGEDVVVTMEPLAIRLGGCISLVSIKSLKHSLTCQIAAAQDIKALQKSPNISPSSLHPLSLSLSQTQSSLKMVLHVSCPLHEL